MSEVIDHVGVRVSELATSRRMYEAALAELGFAVLGEGEFEGDAYVLFGRSTSDDFARSEPSPVETRSTRTATTSKLSSTHASRPSETGKEDRPWPA